MVQCSEAICIAINVDVEHSMLSIEVRGMLRFERRKEKQEENEDKLIDEDVISFLH